MKIFISIIVDEYTYNEEKILTINKLDSEEIIGKFFILVGIVFDASKNYNIFTLGIDEPIFWLQSEMLKS